MVSGLFGLFVLIVTAIYAGELVWRERDTRIEDITDSMPAPTWLGFLAKFAALVGLQVVLHARGARVQPRRAARARAITKLELGALLLRALRAAAAGLRADRRAGAGGAHVRQQQVPRPLRRAARLPRHHAPAPTSASRTGSIATRAGRTSSTPTSTATATSCRRCSGSACTGSPSRRCCLLLAYALVGARPRRRLAWPLAAWPRAHERRRRGRSRAPPLAVFVGHRRLDLLQHARPQHVPVAHEAQRLAADYETQYKPLAPMPQPKITAADVRADIYPEEQRARIAGTLALVNASGRPISDVYVLYPRAARDDTIEFSAPVGAASRRSR